MGCEIKLMSVTLELDFQTEKERVTGSVADGITDGSLEAVAASALTASHRGQMTCGEAVGNSLALQLLAGGDGQALHHRLARRG